MAREVTVEEYKWVVLTLLLTMFVSWALQEIMERGFGLAPKITKASDIHKKSHGQENPMKHYKINRRLTKSLDIKGQYRIQTRGTIYFIKSLYQIFLFIASLYVFLGYPAWFRDHFIYLKADSVHFMPYLHISASLLAFYSWEVIANRYGRLTWSVLVHHWFTAGIAATILLGRYTPFATWYGFCLVSMDFPVFFTLGFRAQFSNKYPSFTRKAFIFSFYWWLFIIILNLCGQLYIIFNSLINHYNESIPISFIIIMLFCICAWLYDDIQLLRGLRDFSTHNYEDAEILNGEDRSLSRNLGGRLLFAMSVLYDIDQQKSEQTLKGMESDSGSPRALKGKEGTDNVEITDVTTPNRKGNIDGNMDENDSKQQQQVTVQLDSNKSDTPKNDNNKGPHTPVTPHDATLFKMSTLDEKDKDDIADLVITNSIRKLVFDDNSSGGEFPQTSNEHNSPQ